MASVHNLIVKRGEAEILKNFSAEFPEHQVTAVSGRSGCGKNHAALRLIKSSACGFWRNPWLSKAERRVSGRPAAAVPHRR